jgi:hypothetical protein
MCVTNERKFLYQMAGRMHAVHHMIVRMFNKQQCITSFAKAMKTSPII